MSDKQPSTNSNSSRNSRPPTVNVNSNNNSKNRNNSVPQQQQQLMMNMRPPVGNNSSNNIPNNNNNSIGRPSGNIPNDFMTFLNGATGNNSLNNGNNNTNSNTTANNNVNANALSRLETIRQYYVQLSNNLRLITQQLQSTDLTPSKRQALLMEQARANAAMQEFTEKILKPISASKQQQAQAMAQQQQQAIAQQQQQQRTPQQPQVPPPQLQQQFQYPRPPAATIPTQPQSIPPIIKAGTAPAPYNQAPQVRPPSVNLYSQSGMGMIRPIISNSNSQDNTTNRQAATAVAPSNIPFKPQQPTPQQAQQSQQQQPSPQRPFRPSAVNVPLSALPTAPVNIGSPAMNSVPGTPINTANPKQPQQQFIVNRQSYLMAIQQHQSSVAQQQLLFQQRLSIFTRDPAIRSTSTSSPQLKRPNLNSPDLQCKKLKCAPILALPPVPLQIKSSLNTNNNSSNITPGAQFRSNKIVSGSYSTARSSSIPNSYSNQVNLAALAEEFGLKLEKEAEEFLLKIADEFIDTIAKKTVSFAIHRTSINTTGTNANGNKKAKIQLSSASKPSSTPSSKKNSMESVSPPIDPLVPETAITIEDLLLGVDEVINYLPAGCGSVQNCRPAVRRPLTSGTGSTVNNSNTINTVVTDASNTASSNSSSNHQHRLNMVKKHSSLYQYYI